jgi:hypothetical protein
MSEERREYFRIDDEVALDYRLIDQGEADNLRERIRSRVVDRFTAASSFNTTSRQMSHIIHRVQNQSPELARCLQAIDQKLNMVAQLFVSEEMNLSTQVALEVNLSAGGVAFRAPDRMEVGSLLELRMVVFPSLVGILTVSRVIQCEPVQDGNTDLPWQVGVAYEDLRETDRELLVRHIMSKETEQLRSQRGEED